MLTGSLLDYRRRKGRVLPQWLDPDAPAPREAAESLIGLVRAFAGRTRGALEEALEGLLPAGAAAERGLPPKAVRGLVKLLLDEAEFALAEGPEPLALRRALFDGAAPLWRERGAEGLVAWRRALLEEAGRPHGLAAEAVARAMFADLPGEQVLVQAPRLSPQALIHRYNVAQVQGLLLGAERLEIESGAPTPARLRQLLRYLKFFGLLFRAEEASGAELRLTVDGPLSVLKGGKGYGLNLAAFFPALLLWPPPWRLRAAVRLKQGFGPRTPGGTHELIVEPDPALRSHYPDHGQWVPDGVRRFVESFNAQDTPWRAEPAEGPVVLPGNRYLVPDFRLVHPDRTDPLLLEHLAYPSPEAVAAKLALAGQVPDARYVLACRALPSLDESLRGSSRLFLYRRQLLAKPFLEWLDGAGR